MKHDPATCPVCRQAPLFRGFPVFDERNRKIGSMERMLDAEGLLSTSAQNLMLFMEYVLKGD